MLNLLIALYCLCSLWGAIKMAPSTWTDWRQTKRSWTICEYLICIVLYPPLYVWVRLTDDKDGPAQLKERLLLSIYGEMPIPDWEQAGYHYDPADDYPQ